MLHFKRRGLLPVESYWIWCSSPAFQMPVFYPATSESRDNPRENVETPGDLFLVDTGLGFPTFRAINLDFEKESPAYRDSFHEYKYIRHEGKIVRMHKHGEEGPRSNLHDGEHFIMGCWHRFCFSETDGTTDLSEFDSDFDAVWNFASQRRGYMRYCIPIKRNKSMKFPFLCHTWISR